MPINEAMAELKAVLGNGLYPTAVPKVKEILQRLQGERGEIYGQDMQKEGLTRREQEVLACLSKSYTNREIADALGICELTVKTHVAHVLLKLQANSRTHAVIIGLRQGLLSVDNC